MAELDEVIQGYGHSGITTVIYRGERKFVSNETLVPSTYRYAPVLLTKDCMSIASEADHARRPIRRWSF